MGTGSFPGVKRPGSGADLPTLRSRKGRAIHLLTLWASVACYRENLYLYLLFRFPAVSIVLPVIHLDNILTRRTSGRSLVTYIQKCFLFSDIRSIRQIRRLHYSCHSEKTQGSMWRWPNNEFFFNEWYQKPRIPLTTVNKRVIVKMLHFNLNWFPNISLCLIHDSWTFVLFSEVKTFRGMLQLRLIWRNGWFCYFNLFIRISSQPWWKDKCDGPALGIHLFSSLCCSRYTVEFVTALCYTDVIKNLTAENKKNYYMHIYNMWLYTSFVTNMLQSRCKN